MTFGEAEGQAGMGTKAAEDRSLRLGKENKSKDRRLETNFTLEVERC